MSKANGLPVILHLSSAPTRTPTFPGDQTFSFPEHAPQSSNVVADPLTLQQALGDGQSASYLTTRLPHESVSALHHEDLSHITQQFAPNPIVQPTDYQDLSVASEPAGWSSVVSGAASVVTTSAMADPSHAYTVPLANAGAARESSGSAGQPFTYYVVGPFEGHPDTLGPGLPPIRPGVQSAVPFVIYAPTTSGIPASHENYPAAPNLHPASRIQTDVDTPLTFDAGPGYGQFSSVRASPYNSQLPSAYSSEPSPAFSLSLNDFAGSVGGTQELAMPVQGTGVRAQRSADAGSGGGSNAALRIASRAASRAASRPTPHATGSGLNNPTPSDPAQNKKIMEETISFYWVIVLTNGPGMPTLEIKRVIIQEALVRAKHTLKIPGRCFDQSTSLVH